MRDELDHGGVQLVLVALRRGAAFEIAHIGALVGDDQRALELAGVALVDAEIGRQLHRAAHARRHVDERAVGEHRRVQRREIVVRGRHHGAEILLHQLGMLADRFRDRHEDHAGLASALPGTWSRPRPNRTPHRPATLPLSLSRTHRRRPAPRPRAAECRASRRSSRISGSISSSEDDASSSASAPNSNRDPGSRSSDSSTRAQVGSFHGQPAAIRLKPPLAASMPARSSWRR